MASAVAVVPVVLAEKSALGALSELCRGPEIPALLTVRSKPLRGDLVLLGECGSEVLDLDELSNERGRGVLLVRSEQAIRSGGELSPDLAHRCDPNDPVVPEAKW